MIDEKRVGLIVANLSLPSKIKLAIALPLTLFAPSIAEKLMPDVLTEEVFDDV